MKADREKYVALLWDEISLQPGLSYDMTHDKIIGFEDWGMRRTRKIADHAITFYLRCLKTGNKIPLGYGFWDSATKTFQLVRCIKEWLSHYQFWIDTYCNNMRSKWHKHCCNKCVDTG